MENQHSMTKQTNLREEDQDLNRGCRKQLQHTKIRTTKLPTKDVRVTQEDKVASNKIKKSS